MLSENFSFPHFCIFANTYRVIHLMITQLNYNQEVICI